MSTADLQNLWHYGWPLIILTGTGFLALVSSVIAGHHRLKITGAVAALGLLAALLGYAWVAYPWMNSAASVQVAFLSFDFFGFLLSALVSLIGLLAVLLSYRYWRAQSEHIPEVFALIAFAVLGMALMVSTTHLLTFVLGLEVMSLSLYILVALRRHDLGSSEASFKYFLLGSVATAFLLFGLSLFYGASGVLDLRLVTVDSIVGMETVFKLGAILILLAFAFKVAAVPLHFWAPDVYEGAPTPITGFMATGVKVAAFGALIRVAQVFNAFDFIPLSKLFLGLSLATMLVGSFTGLRQKSIKRIMAYSSIAHAGYLLLGLASMVQEKTVTPELLSPLVFYLITYSMLTLGAFAVLTALSSGGEEINQLDQFAGFGDKHPVYSAILSLFLLSLAGLPPTAGFFAKYYLFSQAIRLGLYPFAIVGIIASAISLYYYLAPIVMMYFKTKEKPLSLPAMGWIFKVIVAAMVIGVFYLGLFPGRLIQVVKGTQLEVSKANQAD